MNKIEIFDPAMCCSSGVCGTDPEQALIDMAADVAWAREQGAEITRHNLANDPGAFVANETVKKFIGIRGQKGLPLLLIDGGIVLSGRYPNRAELTELCGLEPAEDGPMCSLTAPCCG